MSYPDPPPPPYPFMAPPYSDGDAGDFWPQVPMKRDYLDSHSQFEQPPSFKRPRYSETNLTNFVPPAQSNPRMNPPIPPVNRENNIFYKTRMCLKFLEGNCKKGDSCTFAHGPEDQREPPPNWQELVKDRGAGNWNNDQKIIHTMNICKRFYNGEECPYGKSCNFRHESPAKFRTDMAVDMAMARTRQSSLSIGTMGDMERRSANDRYDLNKHLYSNSDAFQVNMNANSDALCVNENAYSDALRAPVKNLFWKTRMCVKWEVGMCPFGERCHYAHGISELRQVPNGRPDQPREVLMNAAGGNLAAYPSAVVTISDVPPTIPVVPAPVKEGGEDKVFAKWDPNKKINRIYGDWIDDLSSPPRNFLSQVEN